jgi:2-C-methyl-D-erythritol 4-phosphate cytidylyltransferase
VTGGETRAESVRLALAEVPEEAAVVLVHDAARPILPEEVLERVITALTDGWDGVVPVLPVSDTVKRVDAGGGVVETLDRAELVAAQTPQAFLASALRQAVSGLQPQGREFTDCASMVEARGGRIRAVAGDRRLLKVTSPEDLVLVSQWL